MGLFGLKTYTYILSQISHRQFHFESLKPVLLWKTIYLGVQSHHEDQGDFGQVFFLTVNISECNNQLELSVYMCSSYMVVTNPHMKP